MLSWGHLLYLPSTFSVSSMTARYSDSIVSCAAQTEIKRRWLRKQFKLCLLSQTKKWQKRLHFLKRNIKILYILFRLSGNALCLLAGRPSSHDVFTMNSKMLAQRTLKWNCWLHINVAPTHFLHTSVYFSLVSKWSLDLPSTVAGCTCHKQTTPQASWVARLRRFTVKVRHRNRREDWRTKHRKAFQPT